MMKFGTGVDINTWPGVQVNSLIDRLRKCNEWRRGAEVEPPDPFQLGIDIDLATDMLEAMSHAIVRTLENNLHLADGDDCTLIDLVRVARGYIDE